MLEIIVFLVWVIFTLGLTAMPYVLTYWIVYKRQNCSFVVSVAPLFFAWLSIANWYCMFLYLQLI
jgi:hypothetical protein